MSRYLGSTISVVCLALVLYVSLALASTGWASVVEDAQIQYDRGAVLDATGDLSQAIVEYGKVMDYPSPATPDRRLRMVKAAAMTSLAEAQRRSDLLDEAIVSFSRVLVNFAEFRSLCAESAIGIAKVYQKKNEPLKAIEFYSKVLRQYPDKINRADFARVRIEEVKTKTGVVLSPDAQAYVDSAIAVYERVAREEEAVTRARRQAQAKADAGDVEGAKRDLADRFSDPAVYYSCSRMGLLAGAQLSIGDRENARTTVQRYLDLAVNERLPEEYRKTRVENLYNLTTGNPEDMAIVVSEALETLRLYPEGPQMREVRYYLGRAYDRRDEVDKCLQVYDDVINRYSSLGDIDSRSIVAVCLTRSAQRLKELGQVTEARQRWAKVSSEYSDTMVAPAAAISLRELPTGGNL